MKIEFKEFKNKITAAYVAKVAILSALSFVLYMFGKFNLPFMFPSFLEMQFSELPAILAGFSMGPIAGAIVIIVKCLIKFPFTSTVFVGETMDIILGLFYVLTASIIYNKNKTRKNAVIGLIVGTVIATVFAMIFNRVVAIPFYVKLYFEGNFSSIVGMCSSLYPSVTEDTFYLFYIFVAVLPFNLLRLGLVSIITFFVYKRLSKILHWEFKNKKNESQTELTSEINKAINNTNEQKKDKVE